MRADELFELCYGKALVEADRHPGEIPVYGTNGQCGWHNSPLVQGPGVILGRKGQGPLGVEWCGTDFWVIDTAYFLRRKTSNIDLRYSYYLLKFVGLNHLKDGTSNPTLSRDAFGRQLFPIPPLDEQERLAAILTDLDNKIDLNRDMNQTLETMAQVLFQSWFVDFDPVWAKAEMRQPEGVDVETAELFPDTFVSSDEEAVPIGWNKLTLDSCIEILTGGTPRTAESSFWGGEIPWFSVKDAPAEGDVWVVQTEKTITALGLENCAAELLPVGTTIITARGTVGKLALTAIPMTMNQSCYGVRGREQGTDLFTYYLLKNAVGDLRARTHGTVFETITRQTFSSIVVRLPPVEVRQRFDIVIGPMLKRIQANLLESKNLAALRDILLPKLLSGEIRARDAEDQVAASA